jgi:hypothetical protein
MRAFVSHSSADDRYVAEMESFLRAAGFDDVFNDVRSIQPDENFWPEIEKGIANCDSFVVVITAASNSSEWVKREVEYARSLSKKIIPVLDDLAAAEKLINECGYHRRDEELADAKEAAKN